MMPQSSAALLFCAVGALGAPWEVRNNSNLMHGDITALDFALPPGTDEAAGIAGCTGFCANHSACEAWVLVRGDAGGGSLRCAIKGASGWCVPPADDPCSGCDQGGACRCLSAIKPGAATPANCSAAPSPPPPPPPPPPPAPGAWRLPPIDWAAGGVVGPASDAYAVRAFDIIHWPAAAGSPEDAAASSKDDDAAAAAASSSSSSSGTADDAWFMYCDLVLFSNPECPSSFGSEIGVFSAPSLDGGWTYRGIAVPRGKNASGGAADAGGLATPTAVVRGGKVFVYFAYEGLPVGDGLRGIGGAYATHPLGPFTRTPPVAVAPAGWHRPTGPGGILDDPEVLFYGGRFHLFHSRKHVSDLNCSLAPAAVGAAVVDHCVEWRTSNDGVLWERRGILVPPVSGKPMSETMSARVYGSELVIMSDAKGMYASTTNASGLMQDDAAALTWTPGSEVNGYAGLNGSFVNVALRVLPADSPAPTHAAMGWRPRTPAKGCRGGMTFSVFPLLNASSSSA